MKRTSSHRGFLLTVALLLIVSSLGAVAAPGDPEPRTPSTPPRPPESAVAPRASTTPLVSRDYSQLKAVLIVGPIDGDYGDWTETEKDNMDLAAAVLQDHGVQVHKFYAPNTDWSTIKQAANGAHFLLYRGHGVYHPYISDFPHPHVGGFYLSNDQFVSSDQIRDLNLAQNAIVMLYGCFTAGHSSHEEDRYDIGVTEAKRRVAQYSDPFFDAGAGGYFANWFGNAFEQYLLSLFAGKTLGETYGVYQSHWVHRTTHPNHSEMAMRIGSSDWGGYVHYDNAFAGLINETISTLFPYPTLGELPDSVSFVYSIPDGEWVADEKQVGTENVGTQDSLSWALNKDGNCFDVTPQDGSTPASFTVAPSSGVNTSSPNTCSGTITVTVVDPTGVEGSPQEIDVTVRVVNNPIQRVYLPLTLRGYSGSSTHTERPLYPNDPEYDDQWGMEAVRAPDAWGVSCGCPDVSVAIIDSGADLNHPDLSAKLNTSDDYDFVNDDTSADDDQGHGTHVAGIAAAATDNAHGIAGLGWDVSILPLKILDENGYGDTYGLSQAIRYAADHGADVINMSLGAVASCPSTVQEAVNYAYDKGALLVAAAGNHGDPDSNGEMFPANCEHVLGVAATERDNGIADYSNSGTHVNVAAPGSDIYSTMRDGGYGSKWGTSMATPHVSGLAALVLTKYGQYDAEQVASAILDNATDLGADGWDSTFGCGLIDAYAAIKNGAQADSPLCLPTLESWEVKSLEAPVGVEAPFVEGELLVTPAFGARSLNLLEQYGDVVEYLSGVGAWRLQVPAGEELSVLMELAADPMVSGAELNYVLSSQ